MAGGGALPGRARWGQSSHHRPHPTRRYDLFLQQELPQDRQQVGVGWGAWFCWSHDSHMTGDARIRFESTIAGQFFGHTHKDEFQVFFDDVNTTRATRFVVLNLFLKSTSYGMISPPPPTCTCMYMHVCACAHTYMQQCGSDRSEYHSIRRPKWWIQDIQGGRQLLAVL